MNFIDKIVSFFNPKSALDRVVAREQLQIVDSYAQHGANVFKKSLASWYTPQRSSDEDIADHLDLLRARSRDLYMGTPVATGALKAIRTNTVGAGLTLHSTLSPFSDVLGVDEDTLNKTERRIEREFQLWSLRCDALGVNDFGQLQSLALLSTLMSGDCFALLPIVEDPYTPYRQKIRLLEGDFVCNPQTTEGKDILQGVELNKIGKIVAYWICNRHPNSFSRSVENLEQKWVRVEPMGRKSGRYQILHLRCDYERPGQRRGLPLLSPVIEQLKQLTRYTDAELMAAVIASMFTVFIKSTSPMAPIGQAPIIPPTENLLPPEDYKLGSGSILSLGQNESIEIANPNRPNNGFSAFVDSLCSQIGTALELPAEILLKSFKASYSASRGAILEAWKTFQMRRKWLITSFCQPVYKNFLAEAVALGRVDCPGFFEDPLKRLIWCSADWTGPSQGQLDPLKEANAAAIRVENGFSTRTKEAAEISGLNFEELAQKRQREEPLLPLPRIMDPGSIANYVDSEGGKSVIYESSKQANSLIEQEEEEEK